jgi:hypothetical protein
MKRFLILALTALTLLSAQSAFAGDDHHGRGHNYHGWNRGGWDHHDRHHGRVVYYNYARPPVVYRAPVYAAPIYVYDRPRCNFVADPWGPQVNGNVRGYWTEGCYQNRRYDNTGGLNLNFRFD